MVELKSLTIRAQKTYEKRSGKTRRGTLALLAALLITGSVISAGAPAATAGIAPNMCDFAIVIGVRGTGQTTGTNLAHSDRVWKAGGFGPMLTPVRTALGTMPDIPFYFLGLNYPAAGPPGLDQSTGIGRQRLAEEINYVNQQCPYAPIVLMGHSQGASVISQTLTGPVVPGLNQSAKLNIRAVILYGDPTYASGMVTNYPNRPNNGVGYGSAIWQKSGLAGYKGWGWPMGSNSEGWVYKVRDICNAGDFFCQSNPGDSSFAIHNDYAKYAVGSADWIRYMLTDFN